MTNEAKRNLIAVVTGASSGIGHAVAVELRRRDFQLALIGRHLANLSEGHEELAAGPDVRAYASDLRDENQIRRAAQDIERDFGSVDVLVHSAGIIVKAPFGQGTPSDFDEQYRTNVRAPFLLTQLLLPLLIDRRGQVVFINSTAVFNPASNASQYAATKHALKGLADGLRVEVNQSGVRVLSVFLGRTASPMQAAVHASEGIEYRPERIIQPSDVALAVASLLSLPRTVEATEITLRPMQKPAM